MIIRLTRAYGTASSLKYEWHSSARCEIVALLFEALFFALNNGIIVLSFDQKYWPSLHTQLVQSSFLHSSPFAWATPVESVHTSDESTDGTFDLGHLQLSGSPTDSNPFLLHLQLVHPIVFHSRFLYYLNTHSGQHWFPINSGWSHGTGGHSATLHRTWPTLHVHDTQGASCHVSPSVKRRPVPGDWHTWTRIDKQGSFSYR